MHIIVNDSELELIREALCSLALTRCETASSNLLHRFDFIKRQRELSHRAAKEAEAGGRSPPHPATGSCCL